MAKTKSAAVQPAPKKKSAATKPAAKKSDRKPKKNPQQLTADERKKLLRPRDNYDELVERIARTWETHRSLRVPELSVVKLRKLLRDAERAKSKEQALREKLESKLKAAQDSRLVAEDKAWRAVLDVNAAVKLYARKEPSLAETFGFVTDALTSTPKADETSGKTP